MATRNTEKQIFEKALAQAREEDQAGEKARSMLAAPELKNALEDLKRDAPNDQPFLRSIGKLREVKDPGASDRQEQVVAEHPQAHPVGEAPRAKVVVRPRPDPKAHVTSPSIAKREELGLLAPVQAAGKSVAGTVRLKMEGTEFSPNAVEDPPTPPKSSRLWPWLLLVVVLVIGIAALAGWGLNGGEQAQTPSAKPSVARTVVASATASAVETAPVSSSAATVAESSEPTISASNQASTEIRTARSSSAVTASTPAATSSSGAVSVPPPSSLPTPVTTPRTSAPTASAKPSSDRLPD